MLDCQGTRRAWSHLGTEVQPNSPATRIARRSEMEDLKLFPTFFWSIRFSRAYSMNDRSEIQWTQY
jgi:hypothetical protein